MELISDADVGAAIAGARGVAGLGQRELSDLMRRHGINWSAVTVSKVEGGNRAVKAAELPALAASLGVPVTELLDVAEDEAGRVLARALRDQRVALDVLEGTDKLIAAVNRAREDAEEDAVTRGNAVVLAQLIVLLRTSPGSLTECNWSAEALMELAQAHLDLSPELTEWLRDALESDKVAGLLPRTEDDDLLIVHPLDTQLAYTPARRR